MRLSEAIRLGAMLKPQGFNKLGDSEQSCALGAALDAIGKLTRAVTMDDYPAEWQRLPLETCPDCGRTSFSPLHNVTHVNDHHKWTRERIADWVATIEQADVAVDAPLIAEPARA